LAVHAAGWSGKNLLLKAVNAVAELGYVVAVLDWKLKEGVPCFNQRGHDFVFLLCECAKLSHRRLPAL
jgi:hypothetical protein